MNSPTARATLFEGIITVDRRLPASQVRAPLAIIRQVSIRIIRELAGAEADRRMRPGNPRRRISKPIGQPRAGEQVA